MTRDEATQYAFAAGVQYAADSICALLAELAVHDHDQPCDICAAYDRAVGAVVKWAAADLGERQ